MLRPGRFDRQVLVDRPDLSGRKTILEIYTKKIKLSDSIDLDSIAQATSGFAGAAFVIYLSGLTSIKFTATQYALFSSIMLFLPKLIAGYSGAWVDVMGYSNYFILTALLGMPVLFLIYWIGIIAPVKDK